MLAPRNFSDLITFTRASSATRFNASGVLETVGNNVARLDFDPATLAARGLLVEEQRTNSIRNNTMQGTVAGTPGTAPTNWGISLPAGLSQQIIGTGAESGIQFIDIRFFGTTGVGANQEIVIQPESAGLVAAANGQTWTASAYMKYVAGSLAGVNSGEVFLISTNGATILQADSAVFTYGTAPLAQSRQTKTLALTAAGTAIIYTRFDVNVAASTAIDITIRIGLPQLEQGAFPTSPIPTTNAAVTRSADEANVNTLSPWFNASEYTLYSESMVQAISGNTVYTGVGNTFSDTTYLGPGGGSVLSGGVVQASFSSSLPVVNVPYKIAIAAKANDFALSIGGAFPLTDVSGSMPTSNTNLAIGKAPWSSGNQTQQWVRRISYYPRRLSNAELQALTA